MSQSCCHKCSEPLAPDWRTCPACGEIVNEEFPKAVKWTASICAGGLLFFALVVYLSLHLHIR